jgi:hypothetical protein
LNHTLLTAITFVLNNTSQSVNNFLSQFWWDQQQRQGVLIFSLASFLVSIPVFFQAPLVRLLPWLSLILTLGWIWLSLKWRSQPQTYIWGDLLLGFSWSWLAGSIYWGWLRWNPAIHLPVESIALPFALWCIWRGWGLIGNFFYLGSLLGTAITDLYFYLTGLIPYWQELMKVDPSLIKPILQAAVAQVQTPYGISWAIVLANLLLGIGLYSLNQGKLHHLAFAGAVLSTILTDAMFLVIAYFGLA